MVDNKEFRILIRQLFERLEPGGWKLSGTKCIHRLEEVQHTVTARVDNTDMIELGLWVDIFGLPEYVMRDKFLYGQLSSTLWPGSWTQGLFLADFQASQIVGNPEDWEDWINRIITKGINPFFDHFRTAFQCKSLTRDIQREMGIAISRPYQRLIGIGEPFEWVFDDIEMPMSDTSI